MDQPKLGELLGPADLDRDAIHIAIAPCTAAMNLSSGVPVGADGTQNAPVGIVDPFLTVPVRPGDRFYIFLYPNTITSLKHLWTHPDFDDPDKGAGKKWLAKIELEQNAARCSMSFEELLEATKRWLDHTEEVPYPMNEEPELTEGFWDAYEVYTGEKVHDPSRQGFFSCSC